MQQVDISTSVAQALFFCVYADVCAEMRHKRGLPQISLGVYSSKAVGRESFVLAGSGETRTSKTITPIGETITKKIIFKNQDASRMSAESRKKVLFRNFSSFVLAPGCESICLLLAETQVPIYRILDDGALVRELDTARFTNVATRTSRSLAALVEMTENQDSFDRPVELTVSAIRVNPAGTLHDAIVDDVLSSERLRRALDYCGAKALFYEIEDEEHLDVVAEVEKIWREMFSDSFQPLSTYYEAMRILCGTH